MKLKKLFLFATVAAISFCSCNKHQTTETSTSGVASIMCDQSFENIMNQEIDVFEYTYPEASIVPYYVSEAEAVDSLLATSTRLIVIPHKLSQDKIDYLESKKKNVKTQQIAVDAIALIVNNENPVEELSLSEIGDILLGKVTNWNEISPNKSGEIMMVFDHQNSSTVKYMRDSLTNGQFFAKNVFAQGSNQAVIDVVKKRKNAIGVIGVTWLNTNLDGMANGTDTTAMKIKMERLQRNDTTELSYEGNNMLSKDIKVLGVRRNDNPVAYKPYQYYIYTGEYPLYRSIYAICIGANGTLPHGFYSFLTGVISQKIILNTGILPAIMPQRQVTLY